MWFDVITQSKKLKFIFDCFEQSLKRLLHSFIHPYIHPGVDFSYDIVALLPSHRIFLHLFVAQKLGVGEWRHLIELSLWMSLNENCTRNRPQENSFFNYKFFFYQWWASFCWPPAMVYIQSTIHFKFSLKISLLSIIPVSYSFHHCCVIP